MQKASWTSIIWGMILVALGLGFLLDTLGVMSFGNFIGTYWPVVLVLIGLGELVQRKWSGAIIFLGLGLIFLLSELNVITASVWGIIWPLIIIWIGITILIRSQTRDSIKKESKDYTTTTGIFGGEEKKIQAKDFKGASINAVFGGSKLDLRNVEVSKDGAAIDVLVLFGGGEIIVAENQPVHVEATSIFGGVDDKRKNVSSATEGKASIRIQGTVLFGGLEIKD